MHPNSMLDLLTENVIITHELPGQTINPASTPSVNNPRLHKFFDFSQLFSPGQWLMSSTLRPCQMSQDFNAHYKCNTDPLWLK